MSTAGGAQYCAGFHHAIEVLGRRWNGVIIHALLTGAERFGEIRTAVPGLSDRLLTERLRELQGEGILARHCSPQAAGPRYLLTDKGRALGAVIDATSQWAQAWTDPAPPGAVDAVVEGPPDRGRPESVTAPESAASPGARSHRPAQGGRADPDHPIMPSRTLPGSTRATVAPGPH
jgi:DNA-binding HxlR family transcriptional regulator